VLSALCWITSCAKGLTIVSTMNKSSKPICRVMTRRVYILVTTRNIETEHSTQARASIPGALFSSPPGGTFEASMAVCVDDV